MTSFLTNESLLTLGEIVGANAILFEFFRLSFDLQNSNIKNKMNEYKNQSNQSLSIVLFCLFHLILKHQYRFVIYLLLSYLLST